MSGRILRLGPGALIKGILGAQLAIGLLLVGGDMAAGWQGIGWRPAPPKIDQPARPGDQTRRYRPFDRPARPDGTPFPITVDMPDRLSVETLTIDGAQALRLVGQVAPGDGLRIAERLDEAAPRQIFLNSPGGSVSDALELGRHLRAGEFDVSVARGDICLSACPYMLAAGVTRDVDAEGVVGVHQHYFGENIVQPAFLAVEDIQRGQAEVMIYLDEMGIDPLIMRHALATPPNEIYVLLPDELRRYGMITAAE